MMRFSRRTNTKDCEFSNVFAVCFLLNLFRIESIRNETLLRDFPNHQFVAGGATQNTMRAATVKFNISIENISNSFDFQWFLQQPNVSVYMGCVGQDKYHQLLHDAASKAGLLLSYQIQHDTEDRIQTGTCAVLITGNNRFERKTRCFDSCVELES